MINIKTEISFEEYSAVINKVVNDCFPDGTYAPANYELSLKTALLLVFAPEYDLNGCENNNALWERVMAEEAANAIQNILDSEIGYKITEAIHRGIGYRIKMITSGSMSMSDIALSKLFDALTEKVDKIDTSILTKENMNTVLEAVNKTQDGNFANNLVDTMLDKGLLSKPNRKTRRNNGQRGELNKSDITMTSKESDT